MSMAFHALFGNTLPGTHTWLWGLKGKLCMEDRRRAYPALTAILYALP